MQLKYLKKHHYKTLSLDEFYNYYKGKKKIPRKSGLITMDDGYQSNYDLAFPLLKKYGMKATVFYIGSNETGENKNYMNKVCHEIFSACVMFFVENRKLEF